MGNRLVFLNGRDAGTAKTLPDTGTIRLGRSASTQIPINDRNASRVHCELAVSGDEVILTDGDSANGTLVNGERVKHRKLRDRDMITIGFIRLRFEHVNSETPPRKKVIQLLCIQCNRTITEDEVHAGKAQQVGSVFYCAECSAHLGDTDLDETTTVTDFKETYSDGDRVGPYKLIQRVGSGYRGMYWLAGHKETEQKLALKLYDANSFPDVDWALQYMEEVKQTQRFSHPHIVHVTNAGVFGSRFAVAMEFVKGRSLRDIFNARRRISASAAIRIAADLLRALSFLEEHRYIHGDVQPSAVMVVRTGLAKLADFGLKMTLPAMGPGARFKASRGIDFMRYYAPEQFDADAALDNRADVYGVGALLYQLLCARPPFGGPSARDIVTSVRAVMPMPPTMVLSGLPAAVNYAVARALAKRPDERYQSAKEFLADLETILASLTP